MLDEITPLILTFDEAANLERTLDRLRWARRIVIIDSGSADGTLDIAARFQNAECLHRPFDSHATQWNFGLSQVTSAWTLSLDADYELSDALIEEMRGLRSEGETGGYRAPFIYRIFGAPLRGTLYPPRTVLFRTKLARYTDAGHTQEVSVAGRIETLRAPIYHDDRKSIARWFESQQRYAALEADYLLQTPTARLSRTDRLRLRAWPAPILVLPFVLFWKRCLLDGWPGWFYALQRLCAETMIALELIDRRRGK